VREAKAHTELTGQESFRNARRMSLRRRMQPLGMVPDQQFHDREGFTVRIDCRSFAIMKTPPKNALIASE
jgi:hypothetical protein